MVLKGKTHLFCNFYNFRFLSPKEYKDICLNNNFKINYLETISRTYFNHKEYFKFICIEAIKLNH